MISDALRKFVSLFLLVAMLPACSPPALRTMDAGLESRLAELEPGDHVEVHGHRGEAFRARYLEHDHQALRLERGWNGAGRQIELARTEVAELRVRRGGLGTAGATVLAGTAFAVAILGAVILSIDPSPY